MEKILIAAVSENLVIGKEGKIPWYSKEELAVFKETTMDYPIIMGRKTYETIGKPLKGRLNIVLSYNKNFHLNDSGIKIFHELSGAINYCESAVKSEKVYIIGGGEVFNEAIEIADRINLSVMKFNADGDTFFPEIDRNIWCEENKTDYRDFELILFKRCGK